MTNPTYTFTEEDMTSLREFVEAIIKSRAASSVQRYYIDGRADGEPRVRRNLEGYMVELAAARHLDVPFRDYDISPSGNDGNVDLVKGKWKIGVKGTRYPKGFLMVKPEELKQPVIPDRYILGVADVDGRKVELKGYCNTSMILRRSPESINPEYPPAYIIRQRELTRFK